MERMSEINDEWRQIAKELEEKNESQRKYNNLRNQMKEQNKKHELAMKRINDEWRQIAKYLEEKNKVQRPKRSNVNQKEEDSQRKKTKNE